MRTMRRRAPSRAHRGVGGESARSSANLRLRAVSLLFFAFAVAVTQGAIAQADGGDGVRALDMAEPYRAGPLSERAAERRVDSAIEWPAGSRELLAIGVLGAILYGFRASGLSRQSPRAPRAHG